VTRRRDGYTTPPVRHPTRGGYEAPETPFELPTMTPGPAQGATEPPHRKDSGVGTRLRKLRKQTGVSVAVMAERLGWDESRVRHFERGTYDPRISTILRYANAIGARVRIDLDG
jgi:ribosome-binding protein aMBF1 (putative translation factor)